MWRLAKRQSTGIQEGGGGLVGVHLVVGSLALTSSLKQFVLRRHLIGPVLVSIPTIVPEAADAGHDCGHEAQAASHLT